MSGSRSKWQIRSVLREYGFRDHRIYAHGSVYEKITAYRVVTRKSKYCLKPYRGLRRNLKLVCSRTEKLRKLGFANSPKWLTTGKGKKWVTRVGQHYYMTEWIDGSHLGDKEEDHARLGEVLAQLHLISKDRSPAIQSLVTKEINDLNVQNQMFARHLRSLKKRRNESGQWFKEHGKQCLSLAAESWKVFRRPKVTRLLRPSLIHGDLTRPNIIVQPNGLYLVDWEAVRWGIPYYELAKTLSNVTNYSEPLMKALLTGYEKYNPLSPTERTIVASFYRLPREAWHSARELYYGRNAAVFQVLTQSWPKRLEMIRWLDTWAGQQQELTLSMMKSEGSTVVTGETY